MSLTWELSAPRIAAGSGLPLRAIPPALRRGQRPTAQQCQARGVAGLDFTRAPLMYVTSSAMSASSSGASRDGGMSVRRRASSIPQMTAVAFSTRLYRLAAVVRSRTVANGDSGSYRA